MSEIQYVGGGMDGHLGAMGTDVQDLRINTLVPQSEREKILDNFYEYRTNGQDARDMDALAKVERERFYREGDHAPKVKGDELMEGFEATPSGSLEKVYLNEVNETTAQLSKDELAIITKKNAIHELEESTDKTYKSIFAISMIVFTVVLLGILTLAKSLAGLSDGIYMTLVTLVLVGFVLYILYLFNTFYVKDAIDRILGIKNIDIQSTTFAIGKLDKKTYIQEQCRKKKELGYYDENVDGAYEEDPGSANDLLARIGNNKRHYYNDGNAPKQQLFPTKYDSNQFIVFPDYDTTTHGKEGERVKTSGL